MEEEQYIYEEVDPAQQRKRGVWAKLGGGALTFAVIFHVILLIIGAIWIFQIYHEPEKKVDFMPGGEKGGGGERSATTKVANKKRAMITPTTNVKRVFAEGATSTFSIPDPGDSFGEMSPLSSIAGGSLSGGLGGSGGGKGFGKGNGNGNGLGNGNGTGKLFGLIPDTMRKRCSKEDRLQRLRENGGTPACEDAVVKSLRWLKSKQNPDGSWSNATQPAMTGLVLLAYFGHCETPISEEFGESCQKGILYLVNMGLKNDGKMASNFTANSWVYEHAIATYALAEAATFCKDLKVEIPQLMETTQKAGQFIIDNQNENGGWAYAYATYKGHTDTSVVGWQLQALKACTHTGLKFNGITGSVSKGLKYLEDCQNDNGGFGYSGPGASAGGKKFFSLTGVGVLCHQMWGKNGSPVTKGVRYIKDNAKFDWNGDSADLYNHYYMSQAMMQAGGANWTFYNDMFRDQLLNNQNADGTWKAPGFNGHGGNNDVYRNALCTLMLEVYYRFLNSTGSGIQRGAHRI